MPNSDHKMVESDSSVLYNLFLFFEILVYSGEWVSEWVSEWLLFNANSANQLYHGENKIIFNKMMRSALY
jgi:hypothetical protein